MNSQGRQGNLNLVKAKIGNGIGGRKILLVTLDSPFMDSQFVFPYLGVLYLLAVADQKGFKVKYFDPQHPLDQDAVDGHDIFFTDQFEMDNIDQYGSFDLIGISCMTPQGSQAYEISSRLREKFPDMMIMLGGPHAGFYTGQCLEYPFDIIVTGDGERVFQYMLEGNIEELTKLVSDSSTNDKLVFKDQLTEEQMNSFPTPYRIKEYIEKYNYSIDGAKATTLVNSRGCPMGCAFCEHRRTSGRWFTPEHFEKELQDIVNLGIRGVMIFDDLFAISPSRIKPYTNILRRFHRENSMVFRCFGHAKVMAKFPEMAELLSDAGCVEIGFGAESASQKILDTISKGTTVEQMHDFVENAIRRGIKVKAFFIIGLPGETEDTFEETYQFIEKYRTKYPNHFDFDLTVLFPYRGTLIGDIVRLKEGDSKLLDNKDVDRTSFDIRLKPQLSWDEIDNGAYGAYKKKGGLSDVVIETYDWKEKKILLSAERINELKEKVMLLSGRYTDINGSRIYKPVVEGSIGSVKEVVIDETGYSRLYSEAESAAERITKVVKEALQQDITLDEESAIKSK